jgi:hypothetical protein
MDKALPDLTKETYSNSKSLVDYDKNTGTISVKILSNDRDLEDIEQTAAVVCNIQEDTNSKKLLYDHSEFEWKFDYLSEYKLGKDFNKLLPYKEGTVIAFCLGKYYDPSYWTLLEKLINDNSQCTIKYFGDNDEAESWLGEQ